MRWLLSLLRRAVRYELGLYRSLYLWVLRRPLVPEPGAEAFGYSAAAMPLMWTFIIISAVEIPILELILPWETVRRICLAAGVYGLLWMVGLLASLKVTPHILGPSGLRVRNGISIDITIPWQAVAAVRTRIRVLPPGRTVQFEETGSGRVMHIGVASQTSVDVVLREPVSVRLPRRDTEPISELRFHADDAEALVARAREHLESAADGVAARPDGTAARGRVNS